MDAPLKAKSGHQGTAMALAPLAHVLYSRVMRHDPSNPQWHNRDRFILSNGHASILQYAALFLSGYGLELEDLRNFRQWDSLTPGHPEANHTPGVEVTTGPLGQGFANAVGMAIAERYLRSTFGSEACDHHTYVVVGDGCLMEGISHEAASLAGHLRLDRLIAIFDDNKITIDGSTDLTCSDDVVGRFRSYGWNVVNLGDCGEDLDRLESALLAARSHKGQPTLLVLETHIGYPSPDLTDRHEAHGNPFGAEQVARTKEVMGVPDESFWAPDEIVGACRRNARERAVAANSEAGPSDPLSKLLKQPTIDTSVLPHFELGESVATRVAAQKVIEASTAVLSGLIVGAADLTGNTGAKDSKQSAQSFSNPLGRQVYYGIREHAMGAAAVGMALHGAVIPVVGTFFVFADYMRPAIRLASLSKARCVFIFSHDSVGVGEDGPTHQPIEQLASLRAIPGLQVIRPADANETAQAWKRAIETDGPTALILSRQNLPVLTDGSAVAEGGGVIKEEPGAKITLVASGSELSVAVDAAKALADEDIAVRVVSLPSWELFEELPANKKARLIPSREHAISIEAGSTMGWSKYCATNIGIDRFGASAPGAEVMEKLGISASAVRQAVINIRQD